MLKNQNGFHVVLPLLIMVVIGVIGLVGYKVISSNNNAPSSDKRGANYQALNACGKAPLTKLPTDLSRLEFISPLGSIDPPGHTLPTDHMYMMYPYGEMAQKDVYAPADIVVSSVSHGVNYNGDTLISNDYRIDFYPCSQLKVIYGHIDNLAGSLAAQIGNPDASSGAECTETTQGTERIKNCIWTVDIKIPAGEVMGTTDGWDLWATYEGASSPNVTSPEYYHNVDAVCPLDYFTDELKTQLYAITKRTLEPRCGEAYVDKANTLQGGWFGHENPDQARTDWMSHFALARHSVETDIGILALASEDFMYRFTPVGSGTINVEPSQTVAGKLYCYQHEGEQRMSNGVMAGTGKVLLKLTDNHKMQLEHKDGSCADNESFSTPKTYYR